MFKKRELIGDTFVVTHIVDDHHQGLRADQYLQLQYKHRSRNQLQHDIKERKIHITGKNLKPATILAVGDEIKVFIQRHESEPTVDIRYKILYEDDEVLVIDKPGNLPVHPVGRFLFNTLLMILRKQRAEWISKERNFFLTHRLDRETSGVLLLAKKKPVAAELVAQFRERKIEKRYFAIVHGHCDKKQFSVDADIGPAKNSMVKLKKMSYPKDSIKQPTQSGIMNALTHFKVISQGRNVDLLDCELKTGRQHQIRVHLEYIGHPIVGDKLYGNNDARFLEYLKERKLNPAMTKTSGGISRHALHSRYLRFFHPIQEKWVEIESPMPEDMQLLLK